MNLPQEIIAEIINQQKLMGWPRKVPSYAELPGCDGRILFKRHDELNVGDCEQLVEWHSRKANEAIERWKKTGARISLKTAGKNIVRARLYRCQYFSLMGIDDSESDMPFACDKKESDRA